MHALKKLRTSSTLVPLFIERSIASHHQPARTRRPSEASIPHRRRNGASEKKSCTASPSTQRALGSVRRRESAGRYQRRLARLHCSVMSLALTPERAARVRGGSKRRTVARCFSIDRDLPLTLQVALLRVLQERQVVRLGSRKSQPMDVRMIAANEVSMSAEAVRKGIRLRPYSLSVVIARVARVARTGSGHLPLAEHFIVYGEKLQHPLLDVGTRGEASARGLLPGPVTFGSLERTSFTGAVSVAGETIELRRPAATCPGCPRQEVPNVDTRHVAPTTRAFTVGRSDRTSRSAFRPSSPSGLIENSSRCSRRRIGVLQWATRCIRRSCSASLAMYWRTYLKRFGPLSSSSGAPARRVRPLPCRRIRSAPGSARHPLHYRDAVRGGLRELSGVLCRG